MKAGCFKAETDLRRWMRGQKGVTPRWVEPARGSTIGTPDLWFMVRRGDGTVLTVWAELKLATVTKEKLCFEIRPQQRKVMRGVLAEGGIAMILAGEKKGQRVWLMNAGERSLTGEIGEDETGVLLLGDEETALIKGVWSLLGS